VPSVQMTLTWMIMRKNEKIKVYWEVLTRNCLESLRL